MIVLSNSETKKDVLAKMTGWRDRLGLGHLVVGGFCVHCPILPSILSLSFSFGVSSARKMCRNLKSARGGSRAVGPKSNDPKARQKIFILPLVVQLSFLGYERGRDKWEII